MTDLAGIRDALGQSYAAIENLDFPCVSTDDVNAAEQSYRHLASLGHQRIGLVVGPEDHMPSRRKVAAFIDHAERSRADVAPVEHALFSLEGGQAATSRILRHGVTGIICGSDVLALGAIRAAVGSRLDEFVDRGREFEREFFDTLAQGVPRIESVFAGDHRLRVVQCECGARENAR